MTINKSHKQKGFILAAVLWALAIMFVVVGIFHAYVQKKLAISMAAKQSLQRQLDLFSTQQTLLYLLSTRRETATGFTASELGVEQQDGELQLQIEPVGDEIYIDGTPLQGVGSAIFSLQDESGLFALNAQNKSQLRYFMSRCSATDAQQNHLIDTLNDYIDSDDQVRVSGAEKADYEREGREISNGILRTPLEITRVQGWNALEGDLAECLAPEHFSIRRNSIINLNAMPQELLAKMFGKGDEAIGEVASNRHTNPFRNLDDFRERFRLIETLDADEYSVAGGNNFQIKIWGQGGSQTQVISLQLTPFGDNSPWQVDYEYSIQRVEYNEEPMAGSDNQPFGHPLAIYQ